MNNFSWNGNKKTPRSIEEFLSFLIAGAGKQSWFSKQTLA